MQLTFHQLIRLPYRPCLNDVVVTKMGRKFRCVGVGKDNYDGEYQDVYEYREFNTDKEPESFVVTPDKYCSAILNKRLIHTC